MSTDRQPLMQLTDGIPAVQMKSNVERPGKALRSAPRTAAQHNHQAALVAQNREPVAPERA